VLVLGEGGTARGEPYGPLHACLAQAIRTLGAKLYESDAAEYELLADNRFDTYALLDIVQWIERAILDTRAEWVISHSRNDLNIDHEITARAVETACRSVPDSTVRRVLAFYSISLQEYSSRQFQPNVFMQLSEDHVEAKARALACYPTELRAEPHPRGCLYVKIAASYWGAIAGVGFCESFELVREVQ